MLSLLYLRSRDKEPQSRGKDPPLLKLSLQSPYSCWESIPGLLKRFKGLNFGLQTQKPCRKKLRGFSVPCRLHSMYLESPPTHGQIKMTQMIYSIIQQGCGGSVPIQIRKHHFNKAWIRIRIPTQNATFCTEIFKIIFDLCNF